MKNRSRSEIVYDMLSIADSEDGIYKTRLMYKAVLSFPQLEEYLELLTSKELLRERRMDGHAIYNTTEKGRRCLNIINELNSLLSKRS